MKNYKMILAYDGTHFLGWQKTAFGRSVEETLETVLTPILGSCPNLQAASRTDAGVHADAQVVNFFSDTPRYTPQKIAASLRSLLPKDLALISLEEAPLDFHPTLLATHKCYRYELCLSPYQLPKHRAFSWHYPHPLNLELLQKSAQLLLGKKDFSSFCTGVSKKLKDPICHLQAITFTPFSNRLHIHVQGDRFLYKMVRSLIGTLLDISSGKIPSDTLESILDSQQRSYAGTTAPAHGLFLQEIFY